MRLVDDQHDLFAALGAFGGEEVLPCGIRVALWKRGVPPSPETIVV
jgi:hypothetical protein